VLYHYALYQRRPDPERLADLQYARAVLVQAQDAFLARPCSCPSALRRRFSRRVLKDATARRINMLRQVSPSPAVSDGAREKSRPSARQHSSLTVTRLNCGIVTARSSGMTQSISGRVRLARYIDPGYASLKSL